MKHLFVEWIYGHWTGKGDNWFYKGLKYSNICTKCGWKKDHPYHG